MGTGGLTALYTSHMSCLWTELEQPVQLHWVLEAWLHCTTVTCLGTYMMNVHWESSFSPPLCHLGSHHTANLLLVVHWGNIARRNQVGVWRILKMSSNNFQSQFTVLGSCKYRSEWRVQWNEQTMLPLQPHQKVYMVHSMENLVFYSLNLDERWLSRLPIWTTSLIHFSFKGFDRMYILNLRVKWFIFAAVKVRFLNPHMEQNG